MRTARLLLVGLWCLAGLARGACPDPVFTPPERVRLSADEVLIVTHASSTFDARLATKRGIDDAVRFARNHRMPVVVLQDDSPPQFYFIDDCHPDYRVLSIDGELPFAVTPSHVFVAGGHLELCLGRTVSDLILGWARNAGARSRRLTVTYLMDGIYSNGKSLEETDPWYRRYTKFLDIVTWGRPAGEHWPKLTLLEIMGIIRDERAEIEYLKRVLPRWDRTLPPDVRVDLRLNDGIPVVLRPMRGWRAPLMRFEFVDSAARYEELSQ
jgi:hypothetical protein